MLAPHERELARAPVAPLLRPLLLGSAYLATTSQLPVARQYRASLLLSLHSPGRSEDRGS